MSRKIRLTRGKVALVDDEDFEWLNQWKWQAVKGHTTWYAYRYPTLPGGKRRLVLMHRAILCPPKEKDVDHKDRNGLNNQRDNLRVATQTQNNQNARSHQGTTSQFKGVHWFKATKRWQSQIKYNGKKIHNGFFLSEIEAAHAYDRAAMKYFGEFARLNFPGA